MRNTTAARVSLAAAALFVILLAALHVIKPDLDPSWHMISEYEIGRYGWVMQIDFIALAVSCIALCVAVVSDVPTVGGRIGLAFLLLGAIGLTIGGVSVMDPITTAPDQRTVHGRMHGIGFMLGVPSLPLAAVLISTSLVRQPAWWAGRRSLLWMAHLTWISVLVMVVPLFVLLPRNGGRFGPSVTIGWPNRFLVVTWAAWLMLVAWRAIAPRRFPERSST